MSSVSRQLIFPTAAGLTAIILGAFGAHGLESRGLAAESIQAWETAVEYQFYHVFTLIALTIVQRHLAEGPAKWSRRLMIAGMLMFSVSIYGLVLDELMGMNWSFLGPITPLGGTLLTIGWGCFLAAALKGKKADSVS